MRSRPTASGAAIGSRCCCRRAPAVAAAHVAIYKLGAIALPLAMLFGVEAIAYRLEDSGARALITNAQGLAKLAAVRDAAPALEARARRSMARRTARTDFDAVLARAASDFAPGRHHGRRSGADGLHLGHDRSAEGRAACASRAARASSRHRDCRTNSCRSRATGSGRRPTGPGPAACSTCCCRRCITACRWWRAGSTNSIPSEAYALMARDAACAMPSFRRPRCACCAPRATRAGATIALRSVGSGGEALGAETYRMGQASARPHHQRVLRPDRMQSGAGLLRGASACRGRARSASRCPGTASR